MRKVIAGAMVALLLPTATIAQPDQQPCTISTDDQAWVDGAVSAWRQASRTLAGIKSGGRARMILFSADCVLTSDNALTSLSAPYWTRARHAGQVALPNGETVPAGVTSFAGEQAGQPFFLMSLPSVWRSGGVPGGPLGLETLMTAVLLHEATHLSQADTYMARFTRIAEREKLPESFNDDSIQVQFQDNKAFAGSIARETELLYAAAAAHDVDVARRLAGEARALIRARRSAYFVGKDAWLAEVEDIFLTLEGSGQWLGYSWLVSPQGAGLPDSKAMPGFALRGGWWSQDQGLALMLAVDRIGGSRWRRNAFGNGAGAGVDFLDAALAGVPQD